MKKQIVVIHGGETFDSYDAYLTFLASYQIDFDHLGTKGWKSSLIDILEESHDVIAPRMPNAMNAKYKEWKMYFEKYIPHLENGVQLVGHSLGGIFLAKFLSENIFPKTIGATFLVAAPYGNTDSYSLADFVLPDSLELLSKQSPAIFLYHSEDDPIVSFTDLHTYATKLPGSIVRTFSDRGHFDQESFPELIADLQSIH